MSEAPGARRSPSASPARVAGSAGVLARLLDTPTLPLIVPRLSPDTLHRLVRQEGLDACGPLAVLATPAQLAAVLDLDLWRQSPGADERFDAARFGEWLEVLVEQGEEAAAAAVASMPPAVVVAGLSRYVRVFDAGTFEPTAQSDDEVVPHGRDTALHTCEVGGYVVRARITDRWDAVVALLAALDAAHHEAFHALMRGCRRLSNAGREVDGLDDLLADREQWQHDTDLAREGRRARQGYVSPADARAFLQVARVRRSGAATNPVAAAFFMSLRDGEPLDERADADAAVDGAAGASDAEGDEVQETLALMADAGLIADGPRGLLESGDSGGRPGGVLHRLLSAAARQDAEAALARGQELAFLANVLVSGCRLQDRAFTPEEASAAARAVCDLALTRVEAADGAIPDDFLCGHDLVGVFERAGRRCTRR
ncbi:MAG: DUF6178 family protein [Vicinamibacterales bacterium]